jgi:hypothetical protein
MVDRARSCLKRERIDSIPTFHFVYSDCYVSPAWIAIKNLNEPGGLPVDKTDASSKSAGRTVERSPRGGARRAVGLVETVRVLRTGNK